MMHRIHTKIMEEGWIPTIKSEERLQSYLYIHPNISIRMLFVPDSENTQITFYRAKEEPIAVFFYGEYLEAPLEELLTEFLL